MTESKRQPKTPRQRAEEALGVAQRRVAKCQERVKKGEGEVRAAKRELLEAERRLTYVAADPALPQPDQPGPKDEDEKP